jgi:hypothetical protein
MQEGFAPVDVIKIPLYKKLFLAGRLEGKPSRSSKLHKSNSSTTANKSKIGMNAALLYAL